MKTGCAIKPTLRSVDARPQSNRLDGERRDGVFHTPYKNSAFPVTATNASGFYVGELNEAASNTTIRRQFQIFLQSTAGQVVLKHIFSKGNTRYFSIENMDSTHVK
ncbi:uncharacterized protein LOC141863554 isoform X2 [Acropora palmata]|uniref:uncharacterized protein LOC141863554 isoform X2 n=1 Tax=Acropora palmata TaxID=6131 RepID=UPI003DA0686D